MADLSREAAVGLVLGQFLPRDYEPRKVAGNFIAKLFERGYEITARNGTTETVRFEGEQAGQSALREKLLPLVEAGLEDHQFLNAEGKTARDVRCSCGQWAIKLDKGHEIADGQTLWRQHAAAAITGTSLL